MKKMKNNYNQSQRKKDINEPQNGLYLETRSKTGVGNKLWGNACNVDNHADILK